MSGHLLQTIKPEETVTAGFLNNKEIKDELITFLMGVKIINPLIPHMTFCVPRINV